MNENEFHGLETWSFGFWKHFGKVMDIFLKEFV